MLVQLRRSGTSEGWTEKNKNERAPGRGMEINGVRNISSRNIKREWIRVTEILWFMPTGRKNE